MTKLFLCLALSYLGFFPAVCKWVTDVFTTAVNKDQLKLDLEQGHPMKFSP